MVVKRKLTPGGVYSFMALSKDLKNSKFNLRIYVEIFMMSLKMKFYCLNLIMFECQDSVTHKVKHKTMYRQTGVLCYF